MIVTVLFYALVVITVVQIIYFLSFSLIPFKRQNSDKNVVKKHSVSVIIYIKNNVQQLIDNLPSILEQKYADFEVLLINHSSFDESLDVIKKFQQTYTNIRVINVENQEAFWDNKKYALTLGIKAATHEHLLFTDIHCKPASRFWIKEMSNQFIYEKSIVIGHKQLIANPYSFKHLLYKFVNTLTTLKLSTFAKTGNAYKAYHENFAYTKQQFFNVKGFINHLKISLGETDLFLKDASNKKNTTVILKPNSFICKNIDSSFSDFFTAQRNQLQLQSHYNLKNNLFLSLFNFTKVLFYTLIIVLCFYNWIWGLCILASYYIFQYLFLGRAIFRLKEKQILYFLPILDVSYVFFVLFTFISTTVSKPRL